MASICNVDGCPEVAIHRGRCEKHPPQTHRSPSSRVTGTRQWRALRTAVLLRDAHRCRVRLKGCVYTATQVDHVVPVSKGGTNDPGNLRAACAPCNQARNRKGRT